MQERQRNAEGTTRLALSEETDMFPGFPVLEDRANEAQVFLASRERSERPAHPSRARLRRMTGPYANGDVSW